MGSFRGERVLGTPGFCAPQPARRPRSSAPRPSPDMTPASPEECFLETRPRNLTMGGPRSTRRASIVEFTIRSPGAEGISGSLMIAPSDPPVRQNPRRSRRPVSITYQPGARVLMLRCFLLNLRRVPILLGEAVSDQALEPSDTTRGLQTISDRVQFVSLAHGSRLAIELSSSE